MSSSQPRRGSSGDLVACLVSAGVSASTAQAMDAWKAHEILELLGVDPLHTTAPPRSRRWIGATL